MAQQTMDAQRAAASQANVSRPAGLSEPIRLTTNRFAFSNQGVETECVQAEPKDEEENTLLVRQAIEARKKVYDAFSEGLAEALRKTTKEKLEVYIKRLNKELAEKGEEEKAVVEEKKVVCVRSGPRRRSTRGETGKDLAR